MNTKLFSIRHRVFPFGVAIYIAGMAARTAIAAALIASPTISVVPDVYYPVEEILYLEGSAEPHANIQIQFQKTGARPVTMTAQSDGNGEWVLAERVPLEAGAWEVRGRTVASSGETSPWSNPRVIKAVATGLVLGGVSVTYTFLILIFLAAIGAAALMVWYFYSRMKRSEHQTEALRIRGLEHALRERTDALAQALFAKEKQAAAGEVEKSFVELRAFILQELEHLEATAGARALTKEEEEHKERLFAELKNTQEKIESKIEGMEQMHPSGGGDTETPIFP